MGFPFCAYFYPICSGILFIYFKNHLIGIPLFSVIVEVLLESLLIFNLRNNMLSASALFEKSVKLFKIDCFVLDVRIVPQKSCGV